MKNKIGFLALFTCVLTSCVKPVTTEKTIIESLRVYEAFGSMDAKQVEKVCSDYAERVGHPLNADCVYLIEELGVFGEHENIYVDMVRFDYSKLGLGVDCVCVDVDIYGTYVTTLPDPSYGINVFVDFGGSGSGSYSLKDAYDRGIVIDEDLEKMCHWETFNTAFEDFSFSLMWGSGGTHSYDSGTGTLIKDYNPRPENGKNRDDFTTDYHYPDLEGLYEKVKAMNIYSFPTNLRPYEGTNVTTEHSSSYHLRIGTKTILANDCPTVSGYPEGIRSQGRKFLELVFEIIDTIENSDEWKNLPEFEPQYN